MNPILHKFYTNITLLLIYHLIQGQNHCHLHSFHYLDPPPHHHYHHYHRQQQNCPLPLLPLPSHLPQILHHCFQLLFLSDPHLLHLRDWKCNKWVGIWIRVIECYLNLAWCMKNEVRSALKIYRRLLPFPHIQFTPLPYLSFWPSLIPLVQILFISSHNFHQEKYWALAHQNYTFTADYIISCIRKSSSFFCLLPRAFCSAVTSLLCLLSELLEHVKKMLRDFLLDSMFVSVHEVLKSATLGCYKLK